jgi:hypothetical protein
MLVRPFFVGLAATVIFFATFALVSACTYPLIPYINGGSSGITPWILPFFARGMASAISTIVAIAANKRIFKDVPRRPVAISIFLCWAIVCLFVLVSFLIGLFVGDLEWGEIRDDLVFITGAFVSCMIVRSELWPGSKNSG